MRRLLPTLLCSLLLISACATSTPIAVRTPTYHVPPADPLQRATENAALQAAATSQCNWRSAVMSLPGATDNSLQPCKAASATATH